MADIQTMVSEKPSGPLVSVVAVSRNDDHGGDIRGRMQHFVNALISQCRKHQLDAELILVEWNPPSGRPPLEHVLRWPLDFGPVSVRIVTVPAEVHDEFAHSRELPLFQMLGKNVGIRRARGQYVLTTNVDILLNDHVIRYLRKNLKPGIILRADRYDVPAELSRAAPIQEVFEECSQRFFQVCVRYGVFDREQHRILGMGDHLAAKVLAAYYSIRIFGVPEVTKRVARLGLERTVGVGARALGRISDVQSWIASYWARRPSLRTVAGRVYRIIHRKLAHPFASSWTVRRLRGFVELTNRWALARISNLPGWVSKIIRRLRRLVAFLTRLSRSLMNRWSRSEAVRRLERSQTLHTVACGDFTLLSREDWFRLQGYPEWPIFSWHVDSVLLFAASANDIKEVSLGGKYRIYHIDHSIGSGWSAAGEKQLFARLEKKGIPYLSNDDVRRLQKVFADEPGRSIFNGENWGLNNRPLPEREILPAMREVSKSEVKNDLSRPIVRSVGSSCHERV